jgi:ABC-type multidrug transport system ATPase subunit
MSDLAVETQDLTRKFGAFEALKGVNLRVPRGSIFGLVGPNGAGKTTTFSILCGFLNASSGTVSVLGCHPQDRVGLAGRVGALPQDAPLPRVSALEALTSWGELSGMATADAKNAAAEALELVGLGRDATRRASDFSHGMSKRVSIAQALLGQPELVLLDEPTSGLDPKSAFEIKEIIRTRRGQSTIIISSHDLAQIEELCDSVAVIDRGRVIQQGVISELTGQGERIRISVAGDVTQKALATLEALPVTAQVRYDAKNQLLEVRVKGAPAEEAIPQVLLTALESGVRVMSVSRGQRLEERVLELT